jgi:hypothetical protein
MKNYKTTTELLDEIANEMFGKNYRELMSTLNTHDGRTSYTPSEETEIVFKAYRDRHTTSYPFKK